MDDFKEKKPSTDGGALEKEMDDLARVFQEELDKTKAEAETPAELIQPLEDIVPEEVQAEAPTTERDENMCENCGEHKRGTRDNPRSRYCADCEKLMRKFPFNPFSFVVVLAVLLAAVYGCWNFVQNSEIFALGKDADALMRENKLYSAAEAYAAAVDAADLHKTDVHLLSKKELLTAYEAGYLSDISQVAKGRYKDFELSLPYLRGVKAITDDAEIFIKTANDAYAVLAAYEDKKAADIPYETLLAKLVDMETAETYLDVTYDEEGKEIPAENSRKAPYKRAMVSYYKYYLALICGKDSAVQLGFIEEVRAESPEYVWLYASALGELYAVTGKGDPMEIVKLIRDSNAEDTSAYTVEVIAERVKGNYDSALAVCDRGLEADGSLYELHRQKALVYLAKGDYKAAYDSALSAYESYQYSVQVCNTLALASVLTDNETTYNEVKKLFDASDMELSPVLEDYRAGKVTVADIVTKGDYDIR